MKKILLGIAFLFSFWIITTIYWETSGCIPDDNNICSDAGWGRVIYESVDRNVSWSLPLTSETITPLQNSQIGWNTSSTPSTDVSFDKLEAQRLSEQTNNTADSSQKSASSFNKWASIKVTTTEIIPGAKCKCIYSAGPTKVDDKWNSTEFTIDDGECKWVNIAEKKYVCEIQPWLWSFQQIFAQIIRYLVNITLVFWVLAIVGLGIAWSLAGGEDAKAKSSLKSWGINIMIGLVILFLFQYILRFLAPWIYG